MQAVFSSRTSVHDLVMLYEDMIAAAANEARYQPRRILEEQAAKVRSLSDVSLHNLDVDESAPGEPHRGVLKAIDTPMSDYESANKTVQQEPQSVVAPQKKLWLLQTGVSEASPSLQASQPASGSIKSKKRS